MADPDADSDDEFDEHPDYYSVLNIRKEANQDEIKSAYRQMCVIYHPDKHLDDKNKQTAEAIFSKIHKAYEVLSNKETRTIYDVYGQKGLDAGWEVIERKRTPQEIREEYERLQREAEERRIEHKTNPQGSTTLRIDASDLFSKEDIEDDPYYEEEKSFLPHVEIKGMSIKQSIEAPLTKDHTAVLSGNIQHTNGNGSGSVNMVLRKIVSHQSWGEIELGAGNGPSLRLKGFRNINKKTFGTLSFNSTLKQHKLTAGLQAMVARQLSKGTMGYLTWNGGSISALSTVIVKNTEKYHFMAQLQLAVPHSMASTSFTYKFNEDHQAKVTLKYGILGLMVDYGYETKMTSLSRIGAFVSVGQASGVTMKIKVHRHTQTFNFPIFLCDVVSPAAVFYGTVAPVIVYFSVKALFIVPMLREQREKNLKESREKYAQQLLQKRKEAEEAIELMIGTYKRSVEIEEKKHGLVVTEAWYGKTVSTANDSLPDMTSPSVINVTIPLQCLVKESKLLLTDASKSHLNGFYDPCINEDKFLKIIYEFRGAVHEAIFQDKEAVRIPKQSHRISTKVS